LVLDEVSGRLGSGRAEAHLNVEDGARISAGQVLGELAGPADTLLGAERTVLNFVTHLSGVATATAAVVEAVSGLRCGTRAKLSPASGQSKNTPCAVGEGLTTD
jgi:nicotinate-nucleotide pyrophosphorylase (carboxylating)